MSEAVILAVDDEQDILNSIRLVLEMEGYEVQTAHNPIEALQLMEECQPDLIISDINMPQMNGHDFFAQVRQNEEWITIPFIFLSTLNSPENVRTGYQLGADHYLPKPFSVEDLTIAVNSRIRRTAEIHTTFKKDLEATKKQLLHVFSHELRTPLSFINGYLSLLESEFPVTDEILSGMRTGVDRLTNLIGDLMLVVNLENNNIAKIIQEHGRLLDIGLEVEEVITKHMRNANHKRIHIINLVPLGQYTYGLPEYIQNIFERVLDNAVKFSPEDSTITIAATPTTNHIDIHFQDKGRGISTQHQRELFKAMHQIERDVHEQQGVGLGLVICQRLISLHHGAIRVESEEGHGTCVTLTFPKREAG